MFIVRIIVVLACLFAVTESARSDKKYLVALIGDSLFGRPTNHHNLIGKLNANLPEYDIEFVNYGEDGYTIQEIKDALPPVLETKPGMNKNSKHDQNKYDCIIVTFYINNFKFCER